MLEHLVIENFALIEYLELNLNSGLTVFTGETGAGKSILLDAIAFLLGARASAMSIRSGKSYMAVSGYFNFKQHSELAEIIKKYDLEDDEPNRVHIWRRHNNKGKGQIRINGQPASLAILRECADNLIEINGQHGFQQLFQAKNHLLMLDRLGGKDHSGLLREYKKVYEGWRQLNTQLKDLEEKERESIQMLELWKYQDEELVKGALKEGEEETLQSERKRLFNMGKNKEGLQRIYNLLSQDSIGGKSVLSALNSGHREFSSIVASEPSLAKSAEHWADCLYILEELAQDLLRALDYMEEDPYELNRIEERISELASLKRKYGNSITEIIAYHQKIIEKIESSQSNEERVAELKNQRDSLLRDLEAKASLLFASRKNLAKNLSSAVKKELAELEMPKCQFDVAFYRNEGLELEYGPNGAETCEFLIAPNVGEDLKPLIRIGSGGELSRIMLALRSIMLQGDIPIVIFDEIDTGISGQTVQKVAEKLAGLGRHCQLLLVTHQPAVAVMGDHHVFIRKTEEDKKTYTLIKELSQKEIEDEIKRLLVGESESPGAELLAKDLMARADKFKMGLRGS